MVDYLKSENITECECGFDLKNAPTQKADPVRVLLSCLTVGDTFDFDKTALGQCNQSTRFGALLWYRLEFVGDLEGDEINVEGLSGAIGFFKKWPESFHAAIDRRLTTWEVSRYIEYNHTPFRKIFGDVLLHSSRLPSKDLSQNFVLRELLAYLSHLVLRHPKSKMANVGDVLLTLSETVSLLSTSYEQVERLYQEGFLKLTYRPHQQTTIPPHKPAFRLRNVIELGVARMQTDVSSDVYLPAW
ncbi:hypothetical protein [Grimontia hollisae]|uniref:hypothetical protein n=1 Tax=Grimontia hollisae TaxID=673 RepID=UPI001302F2A4|nr:hypothetical protein [Grimontia hollisae]